MSQHITITLISLMFETFPKCSVRIFNNISDILRALLQLVRILLQYLVAMAGHQ